MLLQVGAAKFARGQRHRPSVPHSASALITTTAAQAYSLSVLHYLPAGVTPGLPSSVRAHCLRIICCVFNNVLRNKLGWGAEVSLAASAFQQPFIALLHTPMTATHLQNLRNTWGLCACHSAFRHGTGTDATHTPPSSLLIPVGCIRYISTRHLAYHVA